MRIGVVGHGVVGRRVVSNLFDRAEVARILLITARQTLAGQVKVTLTDERALRDEADVVVLATPDPQHEAARVYLEAGCAVVTTSDDAADVESLLALERLAVRRGRPFVVGAAASPGFTGLLARLAAGELDTVDEIHVAFHGTGGPPCARSTMRRSARSAGSGTTARGRSALAARGESCAGSPTPSAPTTATGPPCPTRCSCIGPSPRRPASRRA